MDALEITFYVLAGISLFIALLLSGQGSSNGLSTISSNEIELFKKTKDRGIIKWLQMILIVLSIVLVIIALIYRFLK